MVFLLIFFDGGGLSLLFKRFCIQFCNRVVFSNCFTIRTYTPFLSNLTPLQYHTYSNSIQHLTSLPTTIFTQKRLFSTHPSPHPHRSPSPTQEWALHSHVETWKCITTKIFQNSNLKHPSFSTSCRASRRAGFYIWNIFLVMVRVCVCMCLLVCCCVYVFCCISIDFL